MGRWFKLWGSFAVPPSLLSGRKRPTIVRTRQWNLLNGPRIHPEPRCSAAATVDCLVVGAYADHTLTPAAQALDAASGGRLSLAQRGDLSGKTGATTLPTVSAPRVLVVGLGDAARFGVPQYLKAVGDAVRALRPARPQRTVHLSKWR